MRVAVLGLGHMGVPIAERIEQAGHELSVWNRSPAPTDAFAQRGATRLTRPAEAWANADLIVTMLADDTAVHAVTFGDDGLLSADGELTATLIDMSTISAAQSAEIAKACEARGVTYLRAPVSGNPSVVVAGNLGIIVSGPRDGFDVAAETLSEIGPNLFYVGPGEQARIVKLALNLMVGGTTQLLAEALVLAEKHGIERATMLDVISGSAIGSPYVKYKRETLLSEDYSSTFTVNLLNKDLLLALESGSDALVPLPVTALVQQLVAHCIAAGAGELDLAVLVPMLELESGDGEDEGEDQDEDGGVHDH
jgi:3-hydroxyisobutyrate dehydrogenase-like beta-hydroxyacid dehydrogenase